MATLPKIKLNQIVAYAFGAGEWKVIGKEPVCHAAGIFEERYNLEHRVTGEVLNGCHRKNIFTKNENHYSLFASLIKL